MNKTKITSAALAIGAAAVFSLTPITASARVCGPTVKCLGVNGCRGFSSCKTATNACKGQNMCKGQGFVNLTREQCKQVLGDNVAPVTTWKK